MLSPELLLLGAAFAVGSIWFMKSAPARLLAFLIGALWTLGGEAEIGLGKIVYGALTILLGILSAINLGSSNKWQNLKIRKPLLVLVIFLVLAIVGALLNQSQNDVISFMRQFVLYTMLVSGPIVALDAAAEISRRNVILLIAALGILSSLSFLIDWVSRRGVTNLDFSRFALATMLLPAACFPILILEGYFARSAFRRILGISAGATIPTFLLLSGTRSALAVLSGLIVLGGKRVRQKVPIVSLLFLSFAVFLISLIFITFLGPVFLKDGSFLSQRFSSLGLFLSGSGEQDLSFGYRALQYQQALEVIGKSPFFGSGLGFPISYTLDTPLITPVRVGLSGTLTATLLLLSIFKQLLSLENAGKGTRGRTAALSFAITLVAFIPFGSPFEDRGLSLALTVITLYAASKKAS